MGFAIQRIEIQQRRAAGLIQRLLMIFAKNVNLYNFHWKLEDVIVSLE
jgi:hypothetical protein